jgi:hypothetical protein
MPTLIALTPENSGPRMTDVPYIVPCDYVAGQPEPEFFKGRRTGRWQRNPAVNHGPITEGAARANTHEHARRATPSEIAAQAPSVGRDELVEVCKKVEAWLYRLAAQADKQAEDTRFPSLVEASKADAKNYRAVATELRHAIAAALAAAGKGE